MSAIDTEIECNRNIALLYYLGRIGCHPQKNRSQSCEAIREADITRALSLPDEKLLTSTLAFLSSIKDDALKITAVCVERRKSGLVVRIAANAKDGHGSSLYLDTVKQGFDGMFKLLKQAPTMPSESLYHRVLSTIMSMCRSRILSRLRFIKRGHKQGLDTIFKTVKKEMARLTLDDDKREFIRQSQVLIPRMEAFQAKLLPDASNALSLDKRLGVIVNTYAEISKIPTISKMLLDDVGLRMDSYLCRGLLNTIDKLAHYSCCAWTLANLSKSHPVLGAISTVAVKLDDEAFGNHQKPYSSN